MLGPVSLVADSLVVLRRRHRQHDTAVDEREQRDLRALEVLLDDHERPGVAEATVEALVDSGTGLVDRHRHRDALAGRQTVGLDDDRGPDAVEIGQRRVAIREGLGEGGGDGALHHEFFRERLRALEPGACCARTEGGNVGGAKVVRETSDERDLGADYDEVDGVLARKRDDRGTIGGVKRDVGGGTLTRGAAVTRRSEDRFNLWGFGQRMHDRVLASAGTDDQNAHANHPLLVRKNCRRRKPAGARPWTSTLLASRRTSA